VRVPYIGESEPDLRAPETSHELDQLRKINLPDLELSIRLNDKLTNYEADIVFFIPVRINMTESVTHDEKAHLEATIHITPHRAGFSFNPLGSVVYVNGRKFGAASAWLEDKIKFRRAIDNYHASLSRASSAVRSGNSYEEAAKADSPDPGEWRDPVNRPVPLTNVGESYWFIVEFEACVPGTDGVISLDLSESLTHPELPAAPLIRFRTIRWSEGHS